MLTDAQERKYRHFLNERIDTFTKCKLVQTEIANNYHSHGKHTDRDVAYGYLATTTARLDTYAHVLNRLDELTAKEGKS